jgi:hypothetical protein
VKSQTVNITTRTPWDSKLFPVFLFSTQLIGVNRKKGWQFGPWVQCLWQLNGGPEPKRLKKLGD